MYRKIMINTSIFLLLFGSANAQGEKFKIKGLIDGNAPKYIYLNYQHGITDSTLIKKGKFTFKGKLSSPVQAAIALDRNKNTFRKQAGIFIEPGKMQLSINYDRFPEEFILTGSQTQDEIETLKASKTALNEELQPYKNKFDSANKRLIKATKEKRDEAEIAQLKNEANQARRAMDPFLDQLAEKDFEFMDQYPHSYITAILLYSRLSGMSKSDAENRYEQLPEKIRNADLGVNIKKQIEKIMMGSPGSLAYNFSATEIKGTPLELSDYRGKYVLIDFWASWCVPCREGNPHLLALYNQYKPSGFEIIGVSDDDSNRESWVKAIEKDKIGVWKHILRGLKTTESGYDKTKDISERYGVQTLPTKILVNPEGIIIGRYGGGGANDEALDAKLKEIFER